MKIRRINPICSHLSFQIIFLSDSHLHRVYSHYYSSGSTEISRIFGASPSLSRRMREKGLEKSQFLHDFIHVSPPYNGGTD